VDEARFLNDRLIVTTGDITEQKVDAIVNAANSTLLGGGGVDGAIHRRGGPAILQECREIRRHRYPEGLPPGRAVITTGGRLAAEHVIHTVGPIWRDGKHEEMETLAEAYRNCLNLAAETGVGSLAFPAISTGVYGFPKELAAQVAFRTIGEHLKRRSLPREVFLVFFAEGDMQIFLNSIKQFL